MTKKIICIAAGGTGGHLFPAVAIAEKLINYGYQILFVTDESFAKYSSVTNNLAINKSCSIIILKNRPRNLLIQKIFAVAFALISGIKLAVLFRRRRVSLVIGFGSYVSLQAILGSFFGLIPSIVHEQNICIGLSNRLCLPLVACCMLSFLPNKEPGKKSIWEKKLIFVGNPVRKEIKKQSNNLVLDSFFKIYDTINILIICGSQGAATLDMTVVEAMAKLGLDIKRKLVIHHQVVQSNVLLVKDIYERHMLKANVQPFFHNVAELMSQAHLIISRAGASSLSEIACLGVPSILVPYPQASGNHQMKNAVYFQQHGASVVCEQKTVDCAKLSQIISQILYPIDGEPVLPVMSRAAKRLSQVSADANVCSVIEALVYGHSVNNFYDNDLSNGDHGSSIGTC